MDCCCIVDKMFGDERMTFDVSGDKLELYNKAKYSRIQWNVSTVSQQSTYAKSEDKTTSLTFLMIYHSGQVPHQPEYYYHIL